MKTSLQRLLLLFICLTVFYIKLTAQPPSFGWVRTAGSATNSEAVIDMVLDSTRAVVVTGGFNGTVDFDAGSGPFNLVSNGRQDIFITKYTSNGNFVWAKSIGGTPDEFPWALKNDRQGNLYLVGLYQSTVDFDPGPGVFNAPTAGGSNTFILKLDKDANFIWVKTFAGLGNTMDIDDNGNIVVGGYFGGTVDFDPGPAVFNMTSAVGIEQDMFVMKLDNLGNFSWAKQFKTFTTSQHQQWGIETDPSGNVFFAGNFTNSIDFDPGPASVTLTSNGSDDAFVLKLNAQGDYQWVAQFGSTGSDKVFGLEVDRQGNVFSTGQFFGTVDFDPGLASFPLTAPAAKRGAFISKLDGTGNLVYAKNFQSGESFGQALAIDSSNNLYISGGFHSTVDFDPGPATYNLIGGELFTAKLTPSGGFIWAAAYTPTVLVFFESIYSAIKIDPNNNVYFGGGFVTTVDFDPGPGVFTVTSNGGTFDMYLHKLGPAPCTNSTTNLINAVACNTYILNATTYNSSGQYYQILTNTAGCDSIIQLNLTISNIQTNLSQTSCGPLLWNGKTLSSTGIYRDTIRLSNGCDSIVVLNLTVNTKPVPNLGIDSVICAGDTIAVSAGTFTSYLWSNGSTASAITVTQPGIYWANVSAANGCTARDSLIITASGNCVTCADPRLVEKIYPTPFNKILTVKTKFSICQLSMDVYNVLGQLIVKGHKLQPGTNTINMEKFPAAAYFYRIYSGNEILAKGKILKQ